VLGQPGSAQEPGPVRRAAARAAPGLMGLVSGWGVVGMGELYRDSQRSVKSKTSLGNWSRLVLKTLDIALCIGI